MTPYNSWCWEQRRAESPIRIQPRAAPWVKIFQQTCALKEQKEGERVSISLVPVALTARWIVSALVPRVLPWAVFLLGLRPAIACSIDCCTLHYSNIVPLLLVTVAAAHCVGLFPFQDFAPSLPEIISAAIYVIFFGRWVYCLTQQNFMRFHDTSVSFRVIPLLR